MLVIDERAADRPDPQGAYFDGSLELLRELAVTIDLDAALPRLSAIVSKMLPHDALRMACFDQRGRTRRERVDRRRAGHDGVRTRGGDHRRSADWGAWRIRRARTRRSGWSAPATARSWECRPARQSPWCAWRSGRSGRWRSTARTCRSRVGSRTTSGSVHAAASSARSPIRSTTTARSGSTRACSEASTV